MGNRGVVVTGASTGIGEACALHLDQLGFEVFAGVRKEADAERLQAQGSDRLRPLRIDVTDAASIAEAAETVAKETGGEGLVGLVNNAGVVVAGPLEFLPIDALRRQLEVNVVGQIAVTQAFLPQLRAGRGRVVNMGSIGGRMSLPFVGPYSASKYAMEALTDSLRMELAPWGVHVSIVEPGSIDTPIWEKSTAATDDMLAGLPAEAHDLYGQDMVAGKKAAADQAARGIPPVAVAKAVAHALSAPRPKTRYVVGRDAQAQAVVARLLPDRAKDALVRRVGGTGKPRQ